MPYHDPAKQRAFQRGWAKQRRAEYLADKSCRICGSTDDLHIHHIDPAEKISHRIWSWSAAKRNAELAKCDILCVEHHNMVHALMRRMAAQRRNPCGTYGSYRRGCKCDLCRQANCDYARTRKERKLAATYEEAEAA